MTTTPDEPAEGTEGGQQPEQWASPPQPEHWGSQQEPPADPLAADPFSAAPPPPEGGTAYPQPPAGDQFSAPPPPGAEGGYPPPAPGAAPPPPAYATGASGPPLSPQDEKTWALGTHLLCLVAGFVAPLIVWLVFRGRGPFLEHHAKEALNFQINVAIAAVVAFVLTFVIIGIFLLIVLVPFALVMPIIAAVKANNGEWYRYPFIYRFVT